MATYSGPGDVKDPIILNSTKESDHQEAEREINRELKLRGINPERITDEEALKELSVAYACWIRCVYEKKNDRDAYATKQGDYEQKYKSTLIKIDEEYAKGNISTGGGAYSSVTVQRG
jgi:hypothetical protein